MLNIFKHCHIKKNHTYIIISFIFLNKFKLYRLSFIMKKNYRDYYFNIKYIFKNYILYMIRYFNKIQS